MRCLSALRFLLCSVAFSLAASPWLAADSPVKTVPIEEKQEKPAQGLILRLQSANSTDHRSARLVALHVPADQSVSPLLPAGPFTARWNGAILSPLRSKYTFSAKIQGRFKLTINDTVVLESESSALTESKPIQLNKGANTLVAEFFGTPGKDASVQLLWASRDFPAEPVPPTAFTHNPGDAGLRSNQRIREGRLLFAQLRCAACHADPAQIPPRGQGMPELAQDAPLFDELGRKFNENFLAHWIQDPHQFRPHALMPRMFKSANGGVSQEAADLAAFLASTAPKADAAPDAELAPAGGALFANLGCIACHTTPDFNGNDAHSRTPLSHLKSKWQAPALAEFLRDPAKNYAWTHMPNFRLTQEEAAQLTGFLMSTAQKELPAAPKGDATRGGQLLATSGCLNCHAGLPPTTQPTLPSTLASGWTKGCMANSPSDRGNAPDFVLAPEQAEALRAFAAHGFSSLKSDSPLEFAERQIRNMRCTACHSADGKPSTWSELEDEMAPLQSAAPTPEQEGAPVASTALPYLTWFGEKLRPDWMENFIAGKPHPKPRPWLIARMPGFAAVSGGVAQGLSFGHGFPLAAPNEPEPAEEQVKNGETLLGENGGFNCITCHAVGDKAATAVFEAPGINLGWASKRLRKEYFHRWLLHPLRIDPETKMPKFADEEGRTPLTDLYEGKASDQFEAIWQFLRTQAR
jgi:cytochrome c1